MFFKNIIFLKIIITKCHLEKCLLSWVSELWIFILNLSSFVVILYYICMWGSGSVFRIRIRIQELRKLLNTDPEHCIDGWNLLNCKYVFFLVLRHFLHRKLTKNGPFSKNSEAFKKMLKLIRKWSKEILVSYRLGQVWFDFDLNLR